jgi:hypothetical protein
LLRLEQVAHGGHIGAGDLARERRVGLSDRDNGRDLGCLGGLDLKLGELVGRRLVEVEIVVAGLAASLGPALGGAVEVEQVLGLDGLGLGGGHGFRSSSCLLLVG